MADERPGRTPRPAGPATTRLGYVDERDVDLVLVLDAHRRGPLTGLLLERAGLTPVGEILAARSTPRCGTTRETDVELWWDGGCLLIEDKIDASFTPGQPESYTTEVAERRERGDQCAAVLVCPSRSLARFQAGGGDAFVYVTCDELAGAAEADGDSLSLAAAIVLRAAEEPPPGAPIDSLAIVWGEAYKAVVASVTPKGESIEFSKTAFRTLTTDWVKVGVVGMAPGADGPWHWFSRGLVSLYVGDKPGPGRLPPAADVRASGKSWRVDLHVAPLNVARSAAEQVEAIEAAVGAAIRLSRWWSTLPRGENGDTAAVLRS